MQRRCEVVRIIEGVQEINARARCAIVKPPAVTKTGDVLRRVYFKDDISGLLWLDGVHHAHITGMLASGNDVVLLDNAGLPILALQVGPQHD